MEIIEKTVIGKKNARECEDGITANNRFIAVIDGSTSKTPIRINPNMSNGRFCMEVIRDFIDNMPADICAGDFCMEITGIISNIYDCYGLDRNRLITTPTERITASAVIYSAYHRQVWMVGDCHCMIDGVYHNNPKPNEEAIAAKRSAFIKEKIRQGESICSFKTNDTGRAHIMADLIASCSQQNIGYAVIDGFDIPLDKIKVIEVRHENAEIILASDGYPFIESTLHDSEHALQQLIAKDPLLISSYKATKGVMDGFNSFDDRSYIKFRA